MSAAVSGTAPLPNHPAPGDDGRWIVELPGGDFEHVGAPRVDVVSGALVFSDVDGNVSFIRAPGAWVSVVPE